MDSEPRDWAADLRARRSMAGVDAFVPPDADKRETAAADAAAADDEIGTASPEEPAEPVGRNHDETADGRGDGEAPPNDAAAGTQAPLPPRRETAALTRIRDKARALAVDLNHLEVTLEHFLIAMTLEQEVAEAFEARRLDRIAVRQFCLGKLADYRSSSADNGGGERLPQADELNRLLHVAGRHCESRRGEEELRVVSVGDIFDALADLGIAIEDYRREKTQVAARRPEDAAFESAIRKMAETLTSRLEDLDLSARGVRSTLGMVYSRQDDIVARLDMLTSAVAALKGDLTSASEEFLATRCLFSRRRAQPRS